MIDGEVALELILDARLLVIVRAASPGDWIPEALESAGARVCELSLTSGNALATLARWRSHSAGLLIGAGTVLTVEDARRAVDAGAEYLVSPGFDESVHRWARDHRVLHIPGVMTPTEVARAMGAGARLIKLFPAGPLGVGYLRQLLGPFPEAEFVATGGVDEDNVGRFLAAGAAAVAIGGAVVGDGRGSEQVIDALGRIQAQIQSPSGGR